MNYQVKQITPSDLASFKQLLKVFGEAFEDPKHYHENVPTDEYLIRFLSKENIKAIGAFDGEKVIGGLVAYVLDKFEMDRREIYIYDLAVDKDYRRKGVATSLIKKLQEIGKELNAYVIFVQADQGDDPAIKLYESLGTKEDVHHFDIKV